MNLNMSLRDINLWKQGKLKAFVIPYEDACSINVGQTVGIKEPFKKLMVAEEFEKDGDILKKQVCVGVMYRTDKEIKWMGNEPNQYNESLRWSSASQLPDYAIRHYAVISSMGNTKPIQNITDDELGLMCLDYPSQNDPQILLDGYLPIKNFELLYNWWKEHYKLTLKGSNNPLTVLLNIQPA